MKMTEYPAISKFTADNILLTDGDNGTKKIFVGDAILSALHMTSPQLHRMIFRGKDLGTSLTTKQKARIQDGSFEDLWLGDYWVIDDVTWRIVDFDYWYKTGNVPCRTHHLVIMPDECLDGAPMNNTEDTTKGGYVGSTMYTSNLANVKTMIDSAFGSQVLRHKEYLCNAVSNGRPSAGAWYDSTVELPSECMMYGHMHFSPTPDGSNVPSIYTIDKTQLALFMVCPQFITNGSLYWLRDVVSSTHFALVSQYGSARYQGASEFYAIRPVFAIG